MEIVFEVTYIVLVNRIPNRKVATFSTNIGNIDDEKEVHRKIKEIISLNEQVSSNQIKVLSWAEEQRHTFYK